MKKRPQPQIFNKRSPLIKALARGIRAIKQNPIDWNSLADDFNNLPPEFESEYWQKINNAYIRHLQKFTAFLL